MTTKKEYSKGYGDRYPNEFTSAKCIWDACEAYKTINGEPPTGKYLKELNLSFKDKNGLTKTVNPNNLDIELNSYKRFIALQSSTILSESVSPIDSNMTTPNSNPLNQILYGPPGTGKTYNTINRALKILDPDFLDANGQSKDRVALKSRFDEFVEAERIVFCTFHQSFSYEDFVEGLRANSVNGQIEYRVESGVFKKICQNAGTLIDNIRPSYVLIIDEINRGNISRIFGELITLIEPSKRTGMNEALSVTLPYSKQSFSVPDNVYLIGTMNTADRSLASLDIALRRRFEFVEMPPRPELLYQTLINGVNIGELLRIMNSRIEVLLGREHCLGHAYFMTLFENPSIDVLANIFRLQIIPLLQEYFFEDWQRISLVLNDHRKVPANRFLTQTQYNLLELFGDDYGNRLQDNRWQINKDAFERIEAYAGLINHEAKIASSVTSREVVFAGFTVRQLDSGTIEIFDGETMLTPVKPKLREMAKSLSVSMLNSQQKEYNTRQLGKAVIDAVEARA